MFDLKRFGEHFTLNAEGTKAYCYHYDDKDVRTAFASVGCSPAISPPEIDYPALTAEGVIVVPPAQIAFYEDMCGDGDEALDGLIEDLHVELPGEIVPFEPGNQDDRIDIWFLGWLYGFGLFGFDLDVCSDVSCGGRPAEYESINWR